MSDTLLLIKQTMIMATTGMLHSGVGLHTFHLYSGQSYSKQFLGFLPLEMLSKWRELCTWQRKSCHQMSAGENDQCVWVGLHEYQLLDKEIM